MARRPLAQKLKLDLGVLLADLAAAEAKLAAAVECGTKRFDEHASPEDDEA